jgi:hypothetical protein
MEKVSTSGKTLEFLFSVKIFVVFTEYEKVNPKKKRYIINTLTQSLTTKWKSGFNKRNATNDFITSAKICGTTDCGLFTHLSIKTCYPTHGDLDRPEDINQSILNDESRAPKS